MSGDRQKRVQLARLAGSALQPLPSLGPIGAVACQADTEGGEFQRFEADVLGLTVQVLGVVGEDQRDRPPVTAMQWAAIEHCVSALFSIDSM